MRKVISFGEALIDMLSDQVGRGAGEVGSSEERFTKYPGGAPANVAAAVGKLGGNSYFAGQVGADMFGDFLRQSLIDAGAKTDYLLQTGAGKTTLAFVSLDAGGERSFAFYRERSADLLFRPEDFQPHWFDDPGIFHFCSNTLTEEAICRSTQRGLQRAREAGFIVSFDVNLRLNLWPDARDPYDPVWACVRQVDLLKVCAEELAFLCRDESEEAVLARILESGVRLLLVTDGGKPLRYYTPTGQGSVQPPNVTMVDSTAAGDAFVGGLLYQLAEREVTPEMLTELGADRGALEAILRFACACGAHAVTRPGAFSSLPARADIAQPCS